MRIAHTMGDSHLKARFNNQDGHNNRRKDEGLVEVADQDGDIHSDDHNRVGYD